MSTLTSLANPQPPAADLPLIPPADRAIIAIGLFKISKGVLFILLAIATLPLMRHDAHDAVLTWSRLLGIHQESRYVQHLLERSGPMVALVDSWRKLISPLLFLYAALFFTEGGGLLLRKHWAEWMTVIMTASLIPLEIYELVVHPNRLKVLAIVINSGILWYLIVYLREARAHRMAALGAAPATPGRAG